jgi:hypothetical protein
MPQTLYDWFTLGKNAPETHKTGDLLGLRANLDTCSSGNLLPHARNQMKSLPLY